jgi:hypothetical protein
MVAMGMMEVAADQIIHVIAMRHRGVAAVGAMDMRGIVAGAGVVGCALIGVGGGHGDDVFIDMSGVGVMQMAVVQVIHMVVVADGEVTAVGAMLMRMVRVDVAGAHEYRGEKGCE